MCDSGARLIIWDSSDQPPDQVPCVLWNGYQDRGEQESLLRRVEQDGSRLRRECLQWFDGLGQLQIDGQSLVDWLELEPGLSYWSMTLVAELNYLKTRAFLDILRLMAIEEIIDERRPQTVRLESGNNALREAISGLCSHRGLAFEWSGPGEVDRTHLRPDWLRSAFQTIGGLLQLVRWLVHVRPLRRLRRVVWKGDSGSLLLVTYNLGDGVGSDPELNAYRRYWGTLPTLLTESGRSMNWMHNFQASPDRRPSAAVASVTSHSNDLEAHAFLQSWITVGLLFGSVRRWRKLRTVARRVGPGLVARQRETGGEWWRWAVVNDDWIESFSSRTALSNLLAVGLFDRVLADMPKQDTGLYLFENQSWEPAFVHAWRKYGHGRLLAIAHTAFRFWDLRLYRNSRELNTDAQCADMLVVNGPAMLSTVTEAGLARPQVVEAEALRFGHLPSRRLAPRTGRSSSSPLQLLVLGDYDGVSTNGLLDLLESALLKTRRPVNVSFRPHPNCLVDPQERPALKIQLELGSGVEAIGDSDLVLGGNVTTAVTESFLLGRRTAVFLDDHGLNYSPLRSQPGVEFVSTVDELRTLLETCDPDLSGDQTTASTYHVNEGLLRWRQLLGLEYEPATSR
jgi:surface carbohydrate biosynthesis protein (TIGR04326 family)